MSVKPVKFLIASAVVGVLSFGVLTADEGMWLLNNLPLQELRQKYNFLPDASWVEKVQKSSARLPNCSASFVSENGLVMTNGHCAEEAVMSLSTSSQNFYRDGFYAEKLSDELKTGLTLMVLESIDETGKAVSGNGLVCEPVSLYQGAVQHNYCYKVYNDIRLVFSSEKNTWFFGGDADNFEYPRYALDSAFLRAYENGLPAKTPFHFKWSASGASDNELIFVSGHPGRTQRLLTSSALATERDVRAPFILDLARRREITVQQFMLRGSEQRRIAESDLFSWQNTRKLYAGKVRGLQDDKLTGQKEQKEAGVLAEVHAKDPLLSKQLEEGQKLVADAQDIQRFLYPRILLYVRGMGFDTQLYDYAESLISGNVAYAQSVLDSRNGKPPLNLEYEEAKLRDSLSHMIEVMHFYDPKVQVLLKLGSGPAEMAHNLVYGTLLADVREHSKLLQGGSQAISGSDDPMIVLAYLVNMQSKTYIDEWKKAIINEKLGYEKIADVVFKTYGTTQYPDATFTLRLSYGTVKGYDENGNLIPPVTTLGGAYRHSEDFGNTGDWKLPDRWMARKNSVNLSVPVNFVSDLDITGGNSGSPVFNKNLEIVGLVFDGNVHSLVSDYDYKYSDKSRAVSVHSAGIIEVLKNIYSADRLVTELTGN